MLKKLKMFQIKSFRQLVIDKKLSIHFKEDKTKSIFFSKAKCLNEVGYFFKQHGTVEYLINHFDSKLSVKWLSDGTKGPQKNSGIDKAGTRFLRLEKYYVIH